MKSKIILLLTFFIINNVLFAQEEKLNIKAFVNGQEIKGDVYNNKFQPPIQGTNYLGSFVNLNGIFELLNSTVNIENNIIEITGSYIGNIKIYVDNLKNIKMSEVKDSKEIFIRDGLINNQIIKIDNEYYITISIVRYLTDGALDQDETKVILYTPDYERLDIPATLIDCYKLLNDKLNSDVINDIKLSNNKDLIKYHMGLGMWIRNNWIYPTTNRIAKIFLEKDVQHPDDISMYIIIGYHYYLNGIIKTVDELIFK